MNNPRAFCVAVTMLLCLSILPGCSGGSDENSHRLVGKWVVDKKMFLELAETIENSDIKLKASKERREMDVRLMSESDITVEFKSSHEFEHRIKGHETEQVESGTWSILEEKGNELKLEIKSKDGNSKRLTVSFVGDDHIELESDQIKLHNLTSKIKMLYKRAD